VGKAQLARPTSPIFKRKVWSVLHGTGASGLCFMALRSLQLLVLQDFCELWGQFKGLSRRGG
jgi:hypothetical protein